MTIVEAIKEAMLHAARPLSAREAYEIIVARDLYKFQAKDPQHVVVMQIRRHAIGVDFPTAAPTKHFKLHGDNTYEPLANPVRLPAGGEPKPKARRAAPGSKAGAKRPVKTQDVTRLSVIEAELWEAHKKYLSVFKQKMLQELKKMTPAAFEAFGRELLDGYGFENTHVTQISKDGGIDGYGRLKVGLTCSLPAVPI